MPKGYPKSGIHSGWWQKGQKPWNTGKHWSFEMRKKMSMAKKGKRPKHIPSFKGHKHTPEQIEKFRQMVIAGHKRGMNKRENNPNWGGGKFTTQGYVYCIRPKHPFKDNHGYVLEHRLIMEKHLGRYLTRNERIHHIDGNKTNNHLDNLMLFSSEREHQLCHSSMVNLIFDLYKQGLIQFDKQTGTYHI